MFLYTIYKVNAVWNVCKVSDKTARKLKNDTKEDYSGYVLKLESGYMVHFLNSHFYEKQKDHRSITFDDIARIGEVVNEYKCVSEGNRPNTLVFRKFTGNGIFELVVLVNDKEKTFSGLSFRIMRR